MNNFDAFVSAQRALIAVGLSVLLSACDQGIAGKFVEPSGMIGLDFSGDGKVVMLEGGRRTQTRNYKLDGDRIWIDMDDGTMEFRRGKDGLSGPFGLQLKPAK